MAAVLVALGATYRGTGTITGTNGADVLRGTKQGDIIRGLEGQDRLYGKLGDDRLYGGTGGDLLVAAGGRDSLFGNAGDDRLHGGPGDDRLVGGPGRDVLVGGAGRNRIEARDGLRDVIVCVAAGKDVILQDAVDVRSASCPSLQPPPPPPPRPGATVILTDKAWSCLGPVDLDLVKVTMRTVVDDAIRIDQNCTGRVGRLEVDTWTADGIKVQNRGTVGHDFVIESGYVKCWAVYPGYHQDGIQVMGGYRLTFRNLAVDCLGNSNFFLSRGGSQASTPTDVVCESCILGPSSASTLFWAPSLRSGARDTKICTGRFRAIRIEPGADDRVDVNNTVLPRGQAACADVTGRGRGS